MFHQVIREAPEGNVEDFVGNSVLSFPVGRIPIGTCGDVREEYVSFESRHAHPIGFLGERLDHQILIIFSPFSHPHVRADDGTDIFDDVLLLARFVVK